MFKADNGAVIYFNKILDLTFGSGLYLSLGVDCARSMSITTYNLFDSDCCIDEHHKGDVSRAAQGHGVQPKEQKRL